MDFVSDHIASPPIMHKYFLNLIFVESVYKYHHVHCSYSWQISTSHFQQSATYLLNLSMLFLSVEDPWVKGICLIACECQYGEQNTYFCGWFVCQQTVNFWTGAWQRLDFVLLRICHFQRHDKPYLASEWTTVRKCRCVPSLFPIHNNLKVVQLQILIHLCTKPLNTLTMNLNVTIQWSVSACCHLLWVLCWFLKISQLFMKYY